VGNFRFRGALVLDHKVYFVPVESEDEANALAAFLNSKTARAFVRLVA